MPQRVPLNDSKSLTLFSDELATKVRVHLFTIDVLEGGNAPCTRCRGLHKSETPHNHHEALQPTLELVDGQILKIVSTIGSSKNHQEKQGGIKFPLVEV